MDVFAAAASTGNVVFPPSPRQEVLGLGGACPCQVAATLHAGGYLDAMATLAPCWVLTTTRVWSPGQGFSRMFPILNASDPDQTTLPFHRASPHLALTSTAAMAYELNAVQDFSTILLCVT